MEDIKSLAEKAKDLLRKDILDTKGYSELENFVLKNGSRLSNNPDFAELKNALDEVAGKFNLKSLEKLQEGFGLNSCAQ